MIARCLAFLLFLLAASGTPQAAEPLARVQVMTKPPIVPGQQIEIQVDVLAPNFFMSPPKFPLFDLPNAVVTLPDERAVNLVETIAGQAFAGIRRTYLVTPQVAGDFTLPPANIPFTYAAVPGQASAGSVTLPPVKFTVAGGPSNGQAAAQRITVTQDLDRDPASLKVGDTLVRSVTVAAQGLQAMMIPVPKFTVPEGVRLYPHDPVLTDVTDPRQGPPGGKRVDRVTYAFETAGSYRLPAIEIAWYDPATQKNEVARAPEITVSVAAAAGFTPAIKPPETQEEAPPKSFGNLWLLAWVAAGLGALALLAWLVPRLWGRLSRWRAARRHRYEQSEAYAFRQFAAACRGGEGAPVYAALQSWAARARLMPLRDWLHDGGAALEPYEQLEARLFSAASDAGAYDAGKLLGVMAEARRKWLERQAQVSAPAALPPLNP